MNDTTDANRLGVNLQAAADDKPKQSSRCVVRLRTATWADKAGLHTKKSLTFLRRKCEGFNVLEEDCAAISPEEVLPRILNMDACEDGVYEVVTCNESRDWATGHVDDYCYQLLPVWRSGDVAGPAGGADACAVQEP